PKIAVSSPAGKGGLSLWPLMKCRSETGIAEDRPGSASPGLGISSDLRAIDHMAVSVYCRAGRWGESGPKRAIPQSRSREFEERTEDGTDRGGDRDGRDGERPRPQAQGTRRPHPHLAFGP